MSDYRYPWPASALTSDDMALLYRVREGGTPRIPITALVAEAVRGCYGECDALGVEVAAGEREVY